MYIKLNFTADKPLNYIFRVVNECINNTGITSVATLQSVATSGTWNANLLSNLDTGNSEIIRTGTGATGLTTSKTISRYYRYATNYNYYDDHNWTVEFSRYDDNTKKYYVQHKGSYNNYQSAVYLADGLSSGTLSSVTSSPPTLDPYSSNSGVGTEPILNAGAYSAGNATAQGAANFALVRSFIAYISDTAMVWCATLGTTYNVGFGNTYSSSASYIGPYIYSQYTRFDYTNTNNNGITPLMFTNVSRGAGYGFGAATTDWTTIENSQYNTTSNAIAFRVFNLLNSYPSTGSSFPVINQPYVNWGVGSRYSDYAGLTASGAGAALTAATAAYGPAIFTTVSTRYPSADLKTQTYGMLPVSWRNLYYYNTGGDASAKGGWYLFNGDYFPGDEFTYGGKVYKILPTWTGYSNRVGIAIPKE